LSLVLTRDDVYGVLRRRHDARLPAFAFVHRQPARVPRGVATLELFARDDVLAANARKSAALRALAPLDAHPQVRHLRERGTLFAFDVALDGDAARGFSRRFFERARARTAAAPDRHDRVPDAAVR
jgi:adenosylmethionine-8-amino-7-oxononanoate aminotransferase